MRFKRRSSKRYASRGRGRARRPARRTAKRSIRPKKESRIQISGDARRVRMFSQSFIDYYSGYHKSKDIMRDLCGVFQQISDSRALDAIACLVERLPYSKYFLLKDGEKATCRLMFSQIHHEMIHHKCVLYTPGAKAEARQIAMKAGQMVRDVASREYRAKAEHDLVESIHESNVVGRNVNLFGVPTVYGALHGFVHDNAELGGIGGHGAPMQL